jgi:N-acetylneuraminate synthase/sialic acid synthase
LQKRDNRSLFTSAYYDRPYNSENSFGNTYGEHREFLEFNFDQYKELQNYSNELGTIFFATAFDFKSADFLQNLDVPAFKIASGDLKNLPLINYLADFGKPLIISTGGGYQEDIDRVVESLENKKAPYSILQCTAGYPPAWSELNLGVISTLRSKFPHPVIGFSSHDNGIAMSVAAYALGARIIEKHFTLARADGGVDSSFSLEPAELNSLVVETERAWLSLGAIQYGPSAAEEPARSRRRSLYVVADLKAGDRLNTQTVRAIRPGLGLAPKYLEQILDRPIKRDIARGTPLSWDLIA